MRASKRRLARMLATATAALLIAACSGPGAGNNPNQSAGNQPTGEAQMGGEVTFAMKTPTWILPISAPGKTQGENGIFMATIFRSLFEYKLGGDNKFNLDTQRSLGEEPEVSEDGLTYTIRIKPEQKWVDGTAISTRDIEFWWNLVTNNKDKWASYREGGFPDNIKEFKVVDEQTFSLTTTEAFSPAWFVSNQLNRITPLPAHAWSKSADDEAVGETDRTPEGAKKIFAYLTTAAEDLSSYGTNELWKTTSGPFKVDSYVPNGEVRIVRNEDYTGQDKAKLDAVVFRPFTGDDAEFNVLRSGGVDFGYIPAGSINQKSYIEGQGYTVEPWNGWSITYMPFNFANPKSAPIFKQKYIRQAMQQLIDQPTISKVVWQDAAAPTCGPVPQAPGAAGTMEGCVYQYNPEAAEKLLVDNGWKINKDSASTCENPGTGPGQCGEGIAAGTALSFTMISQSGFTATTKMMAELKSKFAGVGIVLDIKEVPDSVAVSQKCTPDKPCEWDLSFFGSQSSWYYPVYASGERLFQTDAPVNLGSYSNPEADKLIEATMRSSDSEALQKYNDFLAEDLPVLWMPNPVAQISAWKSDIAGISPQDPMLGVYPQDWARTK